MLELMEVSADVDESFRGHIKSMGMFWRFKESGWKWMDVGGSG